MLGLSTEARAFIIRIGVAFPLRSAFTYIVYLQSFALLRLCTGWFIFFSLFYPNCAILDRYISKSYYHIQYEHYFHEMAHLVSQHEEDQNHWKREEGMADSQLTSAHRGLPFHPCRSTILVLNTPNSDFGPNSPQRHLEVECMSN